MANAGILEEIASWPMEARDDDSLRYFYETDEIKRILSGSKNFVIGRKGTGKTAIAEHILRSKPNESLVTKMSFKNFPWNKIYELEDRNFTPPNQ